MYPYNNNNFGAQYPQNKSGIIWVQGMEGAKAYPVPAGGNAILLDSETDNVFYIKTCDEIGMAKLRCFRFQEFNNTPTAAQFVTREEYNKLLAELGVNNEQVIPRNSSTEK